MSFSLGSRVIAETRIQGVSLVPLVGCYQLNFGLYVNVHSSEDGMQRASIAGARVTLKSSRGDERQLGFARPESPFEINCKPFDSTMTSALHITLQPGQLAAIESIRDTGDLTFELLALGIGGDETGEYTVQDQWSITLPRSDWIGRLRDVGARNILLLEVPLPLPPFADDWVNIAEALTRAEDQYRTGDYHSCIGSCRTIVQELGSWRFDRKDWAGEPLARLANNRNNMSKNEREAALWAVLRHYTHQAHHGPSEGGIPDYSRAEAQFVLSLTAAAVAHAKS